MPIMGGGGGGGVTPPVVLRGTNPATAPLTIISAAGQTEDLLDVFESDGSSSIMTLDQHGQALFKGPASGGNHIFSVQAHGGQPFAIDVIDDGAGAVDTIKLGGATIDLNPVNDTRIRGSAIGFFGAATVAQQTLTSGTATPEQIALALQASTLMGGT